MRITVTQEHIDNGVPVDSLKCPLALAIREATKNNVWSVGVASVFSGNKGFGIVLPKSAREFRHRFDSNLVVQPFEFDIELEKEQK